MVWGLMCVWVVLCVWVGVDVCVGVCVFGGVGVDCDVVWELLELNLCSLVALSAGGSGVVGPSRLDATCLLRHGSSGRRFHCRQEEGVGLAPGFFERFGSEE